MAASFSIDSRLALVRFAFALLVIAMSARGLGLDVVANATSLALIVVLAAIVLAKLVGWQLPGE